MQQPGKGQFHTSRRFELASTCRSLALNPHFWIVVLLFALTSISFYNPVFENAPIVGRISVSGALDLEHHVVERLIYTLLVAYSGWFLGMKAGVLVLVAGVIAMLPHTGLVSPSPVEGVLETLYAALAGALLLLILRTRSAINEERDKQRDAVEMLRLSEENYRELFQNASDAIWVHDLQGNIIDANSATESMSGYTLQELRQVNVKEFMDPEARQLARDIRVKLMKGEPVEPRYEQRLVSRRDGKESVVELTTRLIKHDGQPAAFQNIARDVTEERKLREGLRYYIQRVLVAQEDERKRIARELHDDAAQSVLLLLKRLDEVASSKAWNKLPPALQEKLNQANDSAMEALDGLRRYAQELRPAILDDMGLVAALEWLADNLSREGIEVVTCVDDVGPDLPREAELVLFRIAQEALNNVRRHAEASKTTLTLGQSADSIRMSVTDNGKGFELPARLGDLSSIGKLGMIGMQERAGLLGARLSVDSELGKGTTVTVDIPWENS